MKTAIVIPTIRPESFRKFKKAWEPLFVKHKVELVAVLDGAIPFVYHYMTTHDVGETAYEGMYVKKDWQAIMTNEYVECLSNLNGGIRNLGFAYVARYLPDIEVIITLDDDEVPIGDPIQDHLDILAKRVPISWMTTASEYMRGFPYAVREEAEVVLSHGVWEGVADWDAPTQLVLGAQRPVEFYKGPISKGTYFPMCCMNLAFKRKMLSYIFHAPWANGVNRFDDIFAGIIAKRHIDAKGWAAVTGYARVHHQRESNVFKNLKNEAPGIELNETFWKGDEGDPYFSILREKQYMWQQFIQRYDTRYED